MPQWSPGLLMWYDGGENEGLSVGLVLGLPDGDTLGLNGSPLGEVLGASDGEAVAPCADHPAGHGVQESLPSFSASLPAVQTTHAAFPAPANQ